jgi:hypothetical protein
LKVPVRVAAAKIGRVGLLILVAGCVTAPKATQDPNLLAFLERGPVTRADVTGHLGAPRATFESGHVLTYRLGGSKAGYSLVTQTDGWENVNYDLVLVFDADGELQQHALVDIRPPTSH